MSFTSVGASRKSPGSFQGYHHAGTVGEARGTRCPTPSWTGKEVLAAVLFSLLALLAAPTAASAQSGTTIRGTVVEASTGQPIPSATLQVEGTYRGTVTNRDGAYSLRVRELPVVVVVRFIGYQTERLRISSTDEPIQIRLKESVLAMDEVVVTGDDFADNVMRKVIERKQQWWDSLRTYRVDAYNRFTVRNDTGIVSIVESQTEAFWDVDRGGREIVRKRRATDNMGIVDALPAALLVTNLYQDEVEVAGHTLYGVTHPDALDQYDFSLDSIRVRDGQRVYDIRVEPDTRLTSAFSGRVSVLDSAYAIIDADLAPGRSFLFPPPLRKVQVRFRQQFSSFGGPFWLPVDFRADITLDVQFGALIEIPRIEINQASRLSGYDVNAPLPDSLYGSDRIVVDRVEPAGADTAQGDATAFDDLAVPLSSEEQEAYATIDSTQALEKAFQPGGLLGRFIDLADDSEEGSGSAGASASMTVGGETDTTGGTSLDFGVRPAVWFDRVEGAHLGGKPRIGIGDHVTLAGEVGYGTARTEDAWTYGGGAEVEASERLSVSANYRYGTEPLTRTRGYGRFLPSVFALTGEANYYDYTGIEQIRGAMTYKLDAPDLNVTVFARDAEYRSVLTGTSYDLFARLERARFNLPVQRRRVRSGGVRVVWEDDYIPVAVLGQRRAELTVEHSSGPLGADVTFTRVEADLFYRIPTFLQRRFLPMALDVRLQGMTHTGTLPLPDYGAVDASLLPYGPFGVLRVRDGRPYLGAHAVAGFWEHSFRTVPFELMGLRGLAERGWNVILHGGHARTWTGDAADALGTARVLVPLTDGWHHELGLGLSGLGGLVRIDATARLDEPGYSITLSLPRLF